LCFGRECLAQVKVVQRLEAFQHDPRQLPAPRLHELDLLLRIGQECDLARVRVDDDDLALAVGRLFDDAAGLGFAFGLDALNRPAPDDERLAVVPQHDAGQNVRDEQEQQVSALERHGGRKVGWVVHLFEGQLMGSERGRQRLAPSLSIRRDLP